MDFIITEEILEDSWEEYKNGKVITHEEMLKKYTKI